MSASGSFLGLAPTPSATSVAVDAYGRVLLWVREPASFVVMQGVTGLQVALPVNTTSVNDTGHDLFHLAPAPKLGLACASCHPEGRDDGHVWNFTPTGPRRTPSLVGGLLPTAPFHWDGDLADVDALMAEVFTRRMGGLLEDGPHSAAVARFLNAIPRVPLAPVPAAASATWALGKQLFESPEVGCTTCHNGPHLTNDQTVDVGTGKPLQVPTLIGVGLRAPYLHDGCALTLGERFGPCGGGDAHGHTSQLSTIDVINLVTYLDSL
jgi:hypothetical protein